MQYQRKSYSCSAAALQNALRALGQRVGQGVLERLIGVTEDGADENDLIQAITRCGFKATPFETNRKRDAEQWLKETVPKNPVILCVDNWGHWVSVCGACADRLWLFDPSPSPWNTAENGSWPLLPKTILKRWKAARGRKKEGALYYGISIGS